MPNSELAWRVYDKAMEHLSSFNMDFWVNTPGAPLGATSASLAELENECGTTACFAGWAVAMAGHIVHVWRNEHGFCETVVLDSRFSELGHIDEVAANLLGLDDVSANALFTWYNNDNIEKGVERFFGPRPDSTQVEAASV